jgi:hypothetical protein
MGEYCSVLLGISAKGKGAAALVPASAHSAPERRAFGLQQRLTFELV